MSFTNFYNDCKFLSKAILIGECKDYLHNQKEKLKKYYETIELLQGNNIHKDELLKNLGIVIYTGKLLESYPSEKYWKGVIIDSGLTGIIASIDFGFTDNYLNHIAGEIGNLGLNKYLGNQLNYEYIIELKLIYINSLYELKKILKNYLNY